MQITSNTDLAEKFQMTLTGMKKHVAVLEQARGLHWILHVFETRRSSRSPIFG